MFKISFFLISLISFSVVAQEFQYKTSCPSWVVVHNNNRVCLNERFYMKEVSRSIIVFNLGGSNETLLFNFSGNYSFDEKKFKDNFSLLKVEKKNEKEIRYFGLKPDLLPEEFAVYFAIFLLDDRVEVVVSSDNVSSLNRLLSDLEGLYKL